MQPLSLEIPTVSRPAAGFLLVAVLALAAACDKVALLAPTGSTVNLSVSATSVGSNGSAELIATVIESGGTPVHNGTEVTFQASVGKLDPPVARTEGGIARTTFLANGASGTARITAFSGGARSDEVEVRVGSAAAETVTVRTDPTTVPPTGGDVQVIANVRDASGNPLSGAQVVFSADNGTLGASSGLTDASGEARTSLRTNRESTVRVSVAGKEGTARVTVVSLPSVSLSVSPATPTTGMPVTVTVTPGTVTNGNPIQNVILDLGDGTTRNLGAVTAAQAVSHVYTRADTYIITATAVDAGGQRNTTSTAVTVQRAVVGVSFNNAPTTGQVGTAVAFSVTVTNASNVTLQNVVVSFGDGKTATLPPTGGTVSNTYTAPGTYTVRATARDAFGGTYEATHQIIITAAAPLEVTLDAEAADPAITLSCTPSGNSYPKRCTAPLIGIGAAVRFTAGCSSAFGGASGACPNALSYQWNYGDGTSETSTSRSVDHVYRQPGEYVVTVTVQTSTGNTGSQRLTLIVIR